MRYTQEGRRTKLLWIICVSKYEQYVSTYIMYRLFYKMKVHTDIKHEICLRRQVDINFNK